MNIIEAVKSGRYFKRPQDEAWMKYDPPPSCTFLKEDILAEVWITDMGPPF